MDPLSRSAGKFLGARSDLSFSLIYHEKISAMMEDQRYLIHCGSLYYCMQRLSMVIISLIIHLLGYHAI